MTEQQDFPKTVEEAVNQLMSDLPVHEKRRIARMSEDSLIDLHIGLGMAIRNEFGLWQGNKDLVESCKSMAGEPDLHIDSASSVIIKALWERLKKFPPPKVVREGVTYEI